MQFLSISAGSASELSTQLIIAKELGMGDRDTLSELKRSVNRISQMLQKLIQVVRDKEKHHQSHKEPQ